MLPCRLVSVPLMIRASRVRAADAGLASSVGGSEVGSIGSAPICRFCPPQAASRQYAPPVSTRPRLTVIGTGYLGTTHAACMADLGFEVLGVDIDETKIARLAAGEVPFYEPELEQVLRKNLETGRLRFTTSFADVGDFGDVHFLCVGTPQRKDDYAADLSALHAAVDALAPHLSRPCLVVGKSTVPAGTAVGVAQTLGATAPAGEQVELAWSPEFLREGFAVRDTLRPDRLVFGVVSPRGETLLRAAYAPILAAGTPVVITDFATAELVKVAANAFLATKISFINAMAEELAEGSFRNCRVAVLGAAFKPNSDDIRDSPALDVAATIQRRGATVWVYDPAALDNARRDYPQLSYAESAMAAAAGADLVLHLTEWAEFRTMDPAALGTVVNRRNIVDGRNALDPVRWRAAGWTYRALGRH